MRTASITAAYGRFAADLTEQLGAGVRVAGVRVRFDSRGRCVRCTVSVGGASAELIYGGQPFERGPFEQGRRRSEPQRLPWRLEGDRDATHRLCGALAARLDDLGDLRATLLCEQVEPPRYRSVELTPAACAAHLGPEGRVLAGSFVAFARYFGEPLHLVWRAADSPPSIEYPPVTDQAVLLHAPPPLREDALFLAYLDDLGYGVDARGKVSAVPLPFAFSKRRRQLRATGGLWPQLQVYRATLYSSRAWLTHIADGVLPVNAHGPTSRGLALLATAPLHSSQKEKLTTHFHALAHDMGLHVLACHRVPAARMRELSRLARVALGRGRGPTRRAAEFFEEPFTRTCMSVWAEIEHPDGFADALERHFPALHAELAEAAYG